MWFYNLNSSKFLILYEILLGYALAKMTPFLKDVTFEYEIF